MKLLSFILLSLALIGCGPGNGNGPSLAQLTIPSAGAYHTLQVRIYNNTQWPIVPSVNGSNPTLVISPGGHYALFLNQLPGVIVVSAYTYHIPPYQYPSKILILGRDYADQGVVSVGFP